MKSINVLSLFDGMSCGQIALERAGIPVKRYLACEIDKYAIKVTQKNYPKTYQMGDVTKLSVKKTGIIDLLIGGSPCQGFSFAGKQLNFDDPRSKLFFEFVRLLEECKPKYFLLENVKMKKEYQDVITKYLGVEPIEINSALVSAQNRKRLYWTNIPDIKQPKDRNILLKDILIDGSNKIGRMVGRKINPETGKRDDYNQDIETKQRIEPRFDNKSGTITTVQKDNLVIKYLSEKTANRPRSIKNTKSLTSKSFCLLSSMWKGSQSNGMTVVNDGLGFRNLMPLECERLQTVQDHYTDCVSNTQRYKMLGNGWTVDVIAHIFRGMKF